MAKNNYNREPEDDGASPPQKIPFYKRIFARRLPRNDNPDLHNSLFRPRQKRFSYSRYKNRRAQEPASILRQFCVNLNEAAMIGRLSPVISRESELQQVARILSRRSKNNPLLIGEAGVGKTAIIEGLAQKIVNRELHAWFNDKIIMRLDLPLLVAGTKYRGEFEGRLKKILEAVAMQPNIILFIDEVHTLVGAGSSEGSLDAANILKPALARGELRCISATTSQEYQRYIAKDKALARRFQPIRIEQPSPEQVLTIALGIKRQYERYHKVRIPRKTIEAAIALSERHIPERSMPDKVIDLLDEAAAQARFSDFKGNGSSPRVITRRMVQEVIASWKRIPVEALNRSEKNLLRRLEQALGREIVGQDEAIASLARAIRRRRAGIDGHEGPVGVFLFLGQTGVGKTALAQALAKTLFGSASALVRLDMTEFSEAHSIAKIIGSPPGYVGFQDGGHLTETIRHRPYSIILLDEIEKAHPSIFNILLQLFDDGRLTDSHGNTVDFSNTIVIMTSNLISAESAARSPLGFLPEKNGTPGTADARELIQPFFRSEFSNRIDEILLFKALGEKELAEIIAQRIRKLNENLAERNISISLTPACRKFFVAQALKASRQGARAVQRLVRQHIEDPLAEAVFNNVPRKGKTFVFSMKEGRPVMRTG